MKASPVWDVEAGRDDGTMVGGHLIVAWDYDGLTDDATVRVATWGKFQPATWRWLETRLNEAHALNLAATRCHVRPGPRCQRGGAGGRSGANQDGVKPIFTAGIQLLERRSSRVSVASPS